MMLDLIGIKYSDTHVLLLDSTIYFSMPTLQLVTILVQSLMSEVKKAEDRRKDCVG